MDLKTKSLKKCTRERVVSTFLDVYVKVDSLIESTTGSVRGVGDGDDSGTKWLQYWK